MFYPNQNIFFTEVHTVKYRIRWENKNVDIRWSLRSLITSPASFSGFYISQNTMLVKQDLNVENICRLSYRNMSGTLGERRCGNRSPRGFIKGRTPGKLTGCERDLAINLPGCFHLLFLLSFIRKTKNVCWKTPLTSCTKT